MTFRLTCSYDVLWVVSNSPLSQVPNFFALHLKWQNSNLSNLAFILNEPKVTNPPWIRLRTELATNPTK
jgi:hypothetical protein